MMLVSVPVEKIALIILEMKEVIEAFMNAIPKIEENNFQRYETAKLAAQINEVKDQFEEARLQYPLEMEEMKEELKDSKRQQEDEKARKKQLEIELEEIRDNLIAEQQASNLLKTELEKLRKQVNYAHNGQWIRSWPECGNSFGLAVDKNYCIHGVGNCTLHWTCCGSTTKNGNCVDLDEFAHS